MGAQQIQRSTLAEKLRQQHFEASGEDIGADIEPRFISNARPRHRPQPYDVGVITEAITTDRQTDFALAVMKTPMVMHAAADRLPRSAARTNNCKSSKRSILSLDYQNKIERDCSFNRFYRAEK